MDKKKNSFGLICTRIAFLLSFDEKTLTGGMVYQSIINNIADKHVSGEIKNLEKAVNNIYLAEDIYRENGALVSNQIYKDVYNKILNDPEKSQKFFENIVENITND